MIVAAMATTLLGVSPEGVAVEVAVEEAMVANIPVLYYIGDFQNFVEDSCQEDL